MSWSKDSRPELPRLLLTVTDAATTLGIGRQKMYDLINAGDVA